MRFYDMNQAAGGMSSGTRYNSRGTASYASVSLFVNMGAEREKPGFFIRMYLTKVQEVRAAF
jgi:hypothetical protein